MTGMIVGTIAGLKLIQAGVVFMTVSKTKKAIKNKRKVAEKSWSVTRFLEESRLEKQ